jgi:quercetin dioxygenase-like cupin family protein
MCRNTAIKKIALWCGVLLCTAAAAGAAPATAAAARAAPSNTSQEAIVKQLMTRDLAGAAGKEVLMVTVEYLAGGASLPHRHNAQVFVYVLEGKVRMQVEGSATVTLGPGETFYESPDDIHTISANASRTKSARILVFIIKDKGAPVSTGAGTGAGPANRP